MTEKVKLQNEFWVIEVTDTKGKVGFVMKDVTGVKVAFMDDGGFYVKSTIFKTRSEANDFINKNKMFKKGKVRIVSGSEIAEKHGTVADNKTDIWVIKNQDGKYLKYSAEKNVGYYFDDEKIGACIFNDVVHMGEFIECWQPQFNTSKFTPVLLKDEK
jgi:hypothetical protein